MKRGVPQNPKQVREIFTPVQHLKPGTFEVSPRVKRPPPGPSGNLRAPLYNPDPLIVTDNAPVGTEAGTVTPQSVNPKDKLSLRLADDPSGNFELIKPEFGAGAADFGGDDDPAHIILTDSPLEADSGQLTIALAFYSRDNSGYRRLFSSIGGGQQQINLQIDTNDRLKLTCRDSSGTIVADKTIGLSGAYPAGNWYRLLVSFDLSSTALRHVYVNDVEDTVTWSTYSVSQQIGLSRAAQDWTWGRLSSLQGPFDGLICYGFVKTGYYDFSIEEERRKFFDADGNPVDTSDEGGHIDMPLNREPYGENNGTLDNFTVVGDVTGTGDPDAYTLSVRIPRFVEQQFTDQSLVLDGADPKGSAFSTDGTKFFTLTYNGTNTVIEQWTLSTPFDTSTRVSDGTRSMDGWNDYKGNSIHFSPDGLRFWVYGIPTSGNRQLRRGTITTPWDVTSSTAWTTVFSSSSTYNKDDIAWLPGRTDRGIERNTSTTLNVIRSGLNYDYSSNAQSYTINVNDWINDYFNGGTLQGVSMLSDGTLWVLTSHQEIHAFDWRNPDGTVISDFRYIGLVGLVENTYSTRYGFDYFEAEDLCFVKCCYQEGETVFGNHYSNLVPLNIKEGQQYPITFETTSDAGEVRQDKTSVIGVANPNFHYLGMGSISIEDTANLTPGLPENLKPNDLMFLGRACRNAAQGEPSTPVGWNYAGGRFSTETTAIDVYWKRYVEGEVAPVLANSGQPSFDQAFIVAYRNAGGPGVPYVFSEAISDVANNGHTRSLQAYRSYEAPIFMEFLAQRLSGDATWFGVEALVNIANVRPRVDARNDPSGGYNSLAVYDADIIDHKLLSSVQIDPATGTSYDTTGEIFCLFQAEEIPTLDPANLFTEGQNGAWYDPSDLSTMFQEYTGVTPVTADGDPVGLMLDKSGNGWDLAQSDVAKQGVYRTDGTYHWIEFNAGGQGPEHLWGDTTTAMTNPFERISGFRVLDNVGTYLYDENGNASNNYSLRGDTRFSMTGSALATVDRNLNEDYVVREFWREVSSSVQLFVNGKNSVQANGSFSSNTFNRFKVGAYSGGSFGMPQRWYGAIVRAGLTELERKQCEQYFADRMDIPLYNAWTSPNYNGQLTVADMLLSYGFEFGAGGSIVEDNYQGTQFQEISVDLADTFVLEFRVNLRPNGSAIVKVTLPGFTFDATWNATNNRYNATVSGLTTYLSGQVGNSVALQLEFN